MQIVSTRALVACALFAAAGACLAVPITVTRGQAPSDLFLEDFESFAEGNYNNVTDLPGARMAAIFASDAPAHPDQTIVAAGPGSNTPWESFLPNPPTPGDPLTLLAQGPTAGGEQNLAILNWANWSPTPVPPGASKSVYGLLDGQTFAGIPAPVSTGGAAAVAFLFEMDQSIIGLDIYAVDEVGGGAVAGTVYAYFFDRKGALVDAVAEQLIPRTATSFGDDGQAFTFASNGPKFAGVVLTNDDNFGLNFDNLRYTPVPATGALLLLGLAGLARRRSPAAR